MYTYMDPCGCSSQASRTLDKGAANKAAAAAAAAAAVAAAASGGAHGRAGSGVSPTVKGGSECRGEKHAQGPRGDSTSVKARGKGIGSPSNKILTSVDCFTKGGAAARGKGGAKGAEAGCRG